MHKAEKKLYNGFTGEVLEQVVCMIYHIFPEIRGMSGLQFTHMCPMLSLTTLNGKWPPFHGFLISDVLLSYTTPLH